MTWPSKFSSSFFKQSRHLLLVLLSYVHVLITDALNNGGCNSLTLWCVVRVAPYWRYHCVLCACMHPDSMETQARATRHASSAHILPWKTVQWALCFVILSKLWAKTHSFIAASHQQLVNNDGQQQAETMKSLIVRGKIMLMDMNMILMILKMMSTRMRLSLTRKADLTWPRFFPTTAMTTVLSTFTGGMVLVWVWKLQQCFLDKYQ